MKLLYPLYVKFCRPLCGRIGRGALNPPLKRTPIETWNVHLLYIMIFEVGSLWSSFNNIFKKQTTRPFKNSISQFTIVNYSRVIIMSHKSFIKNRKKKFLNLSISLLFNREVIIYYFKLFRITYDYFSNISKMMQHDHIKNFLK